MTGKSVADWQLNRVALPKRTLLSLTNTFLSSGLITTRFNSSKKVFYYENIAPDFYGWQPA